MDIREEFEKLDEIKATLEKYDGYRVGNKYSTYDTSATAWMNGAWYAFQEQQKKIVSLNDKINKVVRMVYNETDDYYIDEKIQEILHDT